MKNMIKLFKLIGLVIKKDINISPNPIIRLYNDVGIRNEDGIPNVPNDIEDFKPYIRSQVLRWLDKYFLMDTLAFEFEYGVDIMNDGSKIHAIALCHPDQKFVPEIGESICKGRITRYLKDGYTMYKGRKLKIPPPWVRMAK